jgi:5-methylcytosine-specific restriction protein A
LPTRPPNNCLTPGCNQTTTSGHCPDHQPHYRRTANPLYTSRRWRMLRRQVLTAHPICQHHGCDGLATDVDHIIAVRNGGAVYDRRNLQALCRSCHSRKTATEVSLGHR